ncbi:MAG: hypothetical protein RQ757_04510 [Pseudomonadales bacterium]|nr:hypothetical protein [Pseudomonadales bacterium]
MKRQKMFDSSFSQYTAWSLRLASALRAALLLALPLIAWTPLQAQPQTQTQSAEDRPITRLSPSIRVTPLPASVPEISRGSIENFLLGNRLVSQEEFEAAPAIVAATGRNLVIGSGDEIYVSGIWPEDINRFDIVRSGNSYVHPQSGDTLGFEVVTVGAATLVPAAANSVSSAAPGAASKGKEDADNEVRTARILSNTVEIKAGDRLLPRVNESLVHTYYPVPAQIEAPGQIIGLLGESSLAAQFDSVVIDLGSTQGLKVGDLLSIHEAEGTVSNPLGRGNVGIPGQEVGVLMVYRIFENLSYGLILSSTLPASVAYQVRPGR